MGKVVGLNPITTKKGLPGMLVSFLDEYSARDTSAVGQTAETVFVDRGLFDTASGGTPYDKLIGRTMTVVYGRTGFVDGIVFDQPKG